VEWLCGMRKYIISSPDFDSFAEACVSSGAFRRSGSSLFSKIGPASVSDSEGEEDQYAGNWVLICNGLTDAQKQQFNIITEQEV
jgi:hypothetical protein